MKRFITPCLLLLWTACSSQPELPTPTPPTPAPPGVPSAWTQPAAASRAELVSFSGGTACADLERHVEDRVVQEMRVRVEENRRAAVAQWGWRHGSGSGWPLGADAGSASGFGGGTGGGTGGSSGGSGGGAAGGSGGGAGSAPTDYTTTNNQVQGVDEADFVKNDGTRLFVLSGSSLFTASTWPATALARRGQVHLEGRPRAMFLEGDRLAVFSSDYVEAFDAPAWCASYGGGGGAGGGSGSSTSGGCGGWFFNATVVSFVDVSDLSAPRVVARQLVPGDYFDARRIGDAMRLVTTEDLFWPWGLQTWVDWYAQDAAPTVEVLNGLFAKLAADNEVRIRARALSDWLPDVRVESAAGAGPVPLACSDLVSTTASARLGVTNVFTLDLAAPSHVKRQALLADVDELYQSHDALYLAQRQWWWWPSPDQAELTYVYKFDVTQPDRARFAAAGRLEGRPLNQFSFDEHRGYLRVATTVRGQGAAVNRVVVFDERGGELVEVGRTGELAPGEQVMSARFLGDVAYVVTFPVPRPNGGYATDPLFTIDLSQPTSPRVVGELEVPGFSSYVHPLDATHLLTIGIYQPPVLTDWRERHLQLAIYDVGDLAHPRQTFTQEVGTAWGWSEAQWDHKAFNFFAAKGLLAVPFADWYRDDTGAWRYVSDLRVFHVDAQTGFSFAGTLDMADVQQRYDWCSDGYGCWTWYWAPQIRRSVMADDYVYAVASGGVRVAHVDALDVPLATALFDPSP